jgi:LemA protein
MWVFIFNIFSMDTTTAPVASGWTLSRIVFITLVGIVILFGFGLYGFYAGMISQDEQIRSIEAEIGNTYDRRGALVSQMSAVIRSAATYEWGVLRDVTALRWASQNLAKLEQLRASGSLSSPEFTALLATTMGGMRLMAEQYPQLQAVAGFDKLGVTIEGSENRLRTAIKDYNDGIVAHNTKIRSFPYGVLFAHMLGFEKKERVAAEIEKNQKVDTNTPDVGKMLQ